MIVTQARIACQELQDLSNFNKRVKESEIDRAPPLSAVRDVQLWWASDEERARGGNGSGVTGLGARSLSVPATAKDN